MQATEVPLDNLVALSLRSLRRAPTGLAAVLSGAAQALDARLVAACFVPAAGPPETLGSAGPDGPSLSQRNGEDHAMLVALARQMEAVDVDPGIQTGIWQDYGYVAAISSCIDEHISCVVVVGSDRPVDLSTLQRVSAPVTQS